MAIFFFINDYRIILKYKLAYISIIVTLFQFLQYGVYKSHQTNPIWMT